MRPTSPFHFTQQLFDSHKNISNVGFLNTLLFTFLMAVFTVCSYIQFIYIYHFKVFSLSDICYIIWLQCLELIHCDTTVGVTWYTSTAHPIPQQAEQLGLDQYFVIHLLRWIVRWIPHICLHLMPTWVPASVSPPMQSFTRGHLKLRRIGKNLTCKDFIPK